MTEICFRGEMKHLIFQILRLIQKNSMLQQLRIQLYKFSVYMWLGLSLVFPQFECSFKKPFKTCLTM